MTGPARSVATLVCVAAMIGCDVPVDPEVTATGSVSADGQPLSGAVISFEPMAATTGPNASAPIFDGTFNLPADAGLHGGTYRVRIAMMPSELLARLPAPQRSTLPEPGLVIDPRFDIDSRLTCELVAGEPNHLQFEVQFL